MSNFKLVEVHRFFLVPSRSLIKNAGAKEIKITNYAIINAQCVVSNVGFYSNYISSFECVRLPSFGFHRLYCLCIVVFTGCWNTSPISALPLYSHFNQNSIGPEIDLCSLSNMEHGSIVFIYSNVSISVYAISRARTHSIFICTIGRHIQRGNKQEKTA